MSAVKKVAKKARNAVGGVLGRIFKSPSVVVNDNSRQVADAINRQAADEKAAKEAAELKEKQEKEYREQVEKDQSELDNLKNAGTSETSESDLASSGLNDVNADFSETLVLDEEEKKKRSDALRNALMSGR